jgi:hypothetical protein
MEIVSILKGNLECLTTIWYVLRPFGIFCGHLVYFFAFLVCFTKINLAALSPYQYNF